MLFLDIRLLIRRYNTTVIVRWSSTALRYKHDLDTFETLCESCGSGCFAVLRPVKPSEALCVYTVVYVVMLCHLAGQRDTDCFKTLRTSTRSSHLTITEPCIHIVLIALPADGLYMCRIDNASAVWLVRKLDVDAFKSLCLTACSTHHAIVLPALPAKGLYMCAVCNIYIRFACDTWVRIGRYLPANHRRRTILCKVTYRLVYT